jgi:CRISPR-associated protein Cas1
MYRLRFGEALPAEATIKQIRGMEGARVKRAYARAAERFEVVWRG